MTLKIKGNIKDILGEIPVKLPYPQQISGAIKDDDLVNLGMNAYQFRPLGLHKPGDSALWQIIVNVGHYTKPPHHISQRPHKYDKK